MTNQYLQSQLSEEQNHSVVTAVYRESNERETSYYSQRQDGSFVEHRSYNSLSQMDPEPNAGDGVYLNSTTEFFPVDDQDEQVYLDQYSDGNSLHTNTVLRANIYASNL